MKDEFKVQELEQRLEMGKWSPATGKMPDAEDPFTNGQDTWYGAKWTHEF